MAALYPVIKHVHITCVLLTSLFFLARAGGMLVQARWLNRRWVRVAPHLIDTLLLISGVCLTLIIQQYPVQDSWLTAKLLALLAYIVLGSIALKRGKTLTIRVIALLGALVSLGYIISVALSHHPAPWSLLSLA